MNENNELRNSFVYPEIKETDYTFGNQVVGNILRPDRDWRNYLPPGELQRRNGVESAACFIEAQQHTIATILDEQYNLPNQNFSARFNAIFSGGSPRGGDALKAAQTFRDKGLIPDSMLPFATYIDEWVKFSSFLGADMNECLKAGQDWLGKFDPKYDIVIQKDEPLDVKYTKLKDALHYSPIAISIYGRTDATGNYIPKPDGVTDTHLVELVYIDDNNVPTIFDTYEPFVKTLPANYNFDFGIRWTVDEQATPEQLSLYMKIISKLKELIQMMKSSTPAQNVQPDANLPQIQGVLDTMCLAIQEYEGWKVGSRSYRNNNPGNCRFSQVGYLPIYLPVNKDADGFVIFKDYATGFLYLKNLVKSKAKRYPNQTLQEFINKFAPASDNNNPIAYATFVAQKIGVDKDSWQIKNVL